GGLGARRRRGPRAGRGRGARLRGGRHLRRGPGVVPRPGAVGGPGGRGRRRRLGDGGAVPPAGAGGRGGGGALSRGVVEAGGPPFTVMGTHMPLLKDPVWRLAPAVRAALPGPDEPGALAGDMNMWGGGADRLAGPGWRRAVRGRTYPAHRPHSQTDHILVNAAATGGSAEVVPQVGSDHRPVRAHLRF